MNGASAPTGNGRNDLISSWSPWDGAVDTAETEYNAYLLAKYKQSSNLNENIDFSTNNVTVAGSILSDRANANTATGLSGVATSTNNAYNGDSANGIAGSKADAQAAW